MTNSAILAVAFASSSFLILIGATFIGISTSESKHKLLRQTSDICARYINYSLVIYSASMFIAFGIFITGNFFV